MTNEVGLATALLELANENAELRLQLAEAQEQCIELAVDAGGLHAEVEVLRARLTAIERDVLRTSSEQGGLCDCARQADGTIPT